MKRGEELVIVRGEKVERDRLNQKLCFVRSGFEEIPQGVFYHKGLFQPCSKGSEVGGVSRCGGVKVGAEH